MNYPADFTDIIRSVVTSMTFPVTILDVQVGGDGVISIEVCDLYHAEPGRAVTIGGNDYTILTIDDSTNVITLSSGPAITAVAFDLYLPHFFHGTPYDTAAKIDNIPMATDKTPMIFVEVEYREHFNTTESAIERRTQARIYVLTQSNFNTMDSDNLLEAAVKPMQRLHAHFVEAIKNDPRFDPDTLEYDRISKYKFGVFAPSKGVQKGFCAMDLSGIQTDTTMDIYRTCQNSAC